MVQSVSLTDASQSDIAGRRTGLGCGTVKNPIFRVSSGAANDHPCDQWAIAGQLEDCRPDATPL